MKPILLIKLSTPGWEKKFPTYEDARVELLKYICNHCLNGVDGYVSEDGIIFEGDIAPNINSIDDLLATNCGLEFMIDDLEEEE